MAEGVSACSPPRSIPPHARNVDLFRRIISRNYVNYFHTPYLQDRYSKGEESSPKELANKYGKLGPVQTYFSCAESNHLIRGMTSSTFESIKFDDFNSGRPN